MSDTTYRIKPLEWEHWYSGGCVRHKAKTPMGWGYVVSMHLGQWLVIGVNETGETPMFPTLEQAKAACESHWRSVLSAALVPVEPPNVYFPAPIRIDRDAKITTVTIYPDPESRPRE